MSVLSSSKMWNKTLCLMFMLTLIKVYSSRVFQNELNVDDILSTDLMPTFFIINEHRVIEPTNTGNLVPATVNGSIDAALSTLDFHRKMMNEYNCRNYVAEQILEEMGKNELQNRLGKPFEIDPLGTRRTPDSRNNIMYDIGSTNYQEWLAKVAGLNDIYRHYNMSFTAMPNTTSTMGQVVPQDQILQPRDGYEVVENGEATNYGEPEGSVYDVSKHSGGYEYSMPPPPPPLYHHPSAHVTEEHEYAVERDSHGLGIADLFDISLTGIAFLSFGMFVLQVLMCITMNEQPPQVMQMVDNGDTVNVEDVFRFKRSTEPSRSVTALNNVARYALMAFRPRSTACLHRALCHGNKYARQIRDTNKYWLSLWQGRYLASSKAENNLCACFSAKRCGCSCIEKKSKLSYKTI